MFAWKFLNNKIAVYCTRSAGCDADIYQRARLQQELTIWIYKSSPVRGVDISKPEGKGFRLLGIPTVRGRVVQATLKMLLEPVFDPYFSPNSYGFRRGRSQHQAVGAARQIVNKDNPYVVDIEFFDRIRHDRRIARPNHERQSDKLIVSGNVNGSLPPNDRIHKKFHTLNKFNILINNYRST